MKEMALDVDEDDDDEEEEEEDQSEEEYCESDPEEEAGPSGEQDWSPTPRMFGLNWLTVMAVVEQLSYPVSFFFNLILFLKNFYS